MRNLVVVNDPKEWSFPQEGVEIVAYLDPATGNTLFVDVVARGAQRSFETAPLRWSTWSPPAMPTA